MEITRNTLDTTKGTPDWFTGDVYVDAAAAPVTPRQASDGPEPLLARGPRLNQSRRRPATIAFAN
jgi:hypothetical protein